jgi:signal transduction histidine kinase/ligand-binding sensor domain-containing protein
VTLYKALVRFFACIILLCIALPSFSQSGRENISFEKISIPGTIRSSQVSDIIQDKHGLIWIAGDCLYQYDGLQFLQIKELSDGKHKLNPSDIHILFYDDRNDRLFLGTHRFGVVAYDYGTGKLTALPSTISPTPVIHQIAQTSDGRIWVGSHGGGLFYLENDTLKESSESKKHSIYPLSLAARGNRLYVGESAKLYVIEGDRVVDKIRLEWDGKDFPVNTRVTALTFDRNGKMWLGTESQGVFQYDLSQSKFVKHFDPSTPPFYSRVSRIREDQDGFIWILTKASGVAVYDPITNRNILLRKDPFSKTSLSSDNCFSILEDREGIIWIGATGDLNKYDREQIRFTHIFHNPLEKISLSDNMSRGIQEDHLGRIWIGTDGGIINVLDQKGQRVDQIKIKLGKDSINYVPLYFSQLNERTMLIGTSHGLIQYDLHQKKFSRVDAVWDITKGKTVRQVLYRDNLIYFITSGYLFIHNVKTKKTEYYNKFGDRIATNTTTFHLDENNNLWIGLNRGVALFNREQKNFKFFHFKDVPIPSDRSLLLVLSIQQIGSKLFVGTFNAGLWQFDISNPALLQLEKRYMETDGLPSNTVYSTLDDEKGKIWVSTNAGICQYNPEKKQFISFSISEGLQDEEFNRLAYLKTRSGQMIFGGINGVNIFDPNQIHIDSMAFEPRILRVSINNPLDPAANFNRPFPGKEVLSLEYNQNFINFHFFIPHYQQPKRYKTFFYLKNFEKGWNEASGSNVASYANLQPGAYTFIVKTVGIAGQEHITGTRILISPPYYKTWWFIGLTFLTVGFLVLTIIRSYIRKAQFDRQRLEELLKIRTFEIERSKEELHILNQKKDLIFSILSHDLRSPLTTLKGFLGYLINHAHEMSMEELKKHAVSIKNSVTNSLDLIDNTLFWSLSQMGNIQYSPSNFSLQILLDKLRGLYQLTADKKKIVLNIHCEDELIIFGDENMVYVTLRNLVSNALKFSEEGSLVTVTCIRNNGHAEINVVDSGIGMSPEYLKKVLSMDQPLLKKGTSNEKGTGLGLLLCKKFIEMNKGEIRISSVEHKGTTFTVTLPLTVDQPVELKA